MTCFGVLILIFGTMYPVQRGRLWVSAQSPTESPVSQPDEELSVDIGDSPTLRCCVSEKVTGMIAWFKQLNTEKPQLIVTFYRSGGETFYSGFQESRFQIKRSSNCFNMTILNILQSDEAMYYCALTFPNIVFAEGTYLQIKARCDHSVGCEPTRHGNSTNMRNTQENTVLGLGTALGVCALLIVYLACFILRRRKCGNTRMKGPEDFPATRQEYEAETLNYAAVQFTKKKGKKGKTDTSTECVYSDVNKNGGSTNY